jgi:hypothetical protein
MRKSVILPARSFARARGPTSGRRYGPRSRVGLMFLILTLNPIGPDRFRHALENAYWAPSMIPACCGIRWCGRDRRKLSFNEEEIPRLTGRSCGGFPGIGRTLPSRHLRNRSLAVSANWADVCASRLIGRSPARAVGSAGQRTRPSSGFCLRHYDPCEPPCALSAWVSRAV